MRGRALRRRYGRAKTIMTKAPGAGLGQTIDVERRAWTDPTAPLVVAGTNRPGTYNIIQRKSGMSVGFFVRLKDAKAALHALLPLIDWSTQDPEAIAHTPGLYEKVRAVTRAHGAL